MKLLVTGATGCLGQAFVRLARKRGAHVMAVSRRAPPAQTTVDSCPTDTRHTDAAPNEAAVTWVQGDITRIAWDGLIDACDGVVHLAGLAHAPRSTPKEHFFASNAHATERLADVAQRLRRPLVLASSVAVYGLPFADAACEATPLRGRSPYAASKLAGDCAVRACGGIALRLPACYGPQGRGAVHELARLVQAGFVDAHVMPHVQRSFLAADNAAQGLWQALTRGRPGEAYNVTDDDDIALKDLTARMQTRLAQRHAAHAALVRHAARYGLAAGQWLLRRGVALPPPATRLQQVVQTLTFDVSKARQELGYEPCVTLAAGLDQMFDAMNSRRAPRVSGSPSRDPAG